VGHTIFGRPDACQAATDLAAVSTSSNLDHDHARGCVWWVGRCSLVSLWSHSDPKRSLLAKVEPGVATYSVLTPTDYPKRLQSPRGRDGTRDPHRCGCCSFSLSDGVGSSSAAALAAAAPSNAVSTVHLNRAALFLFFSLAKRSIQQEATVEE